jgi:uncharacterized membrane-anchored protein
MDDAKEAPQIKVPEVTIAFWIAKILATTLGETGGDSLSMSMGLGYLKSSAIFAVVFLFAAALQIGTKRFHSTIYWFAIVASTTVGTTLADLATRDLGIGYAGGSLLLFACVLASLATWRLVIGTVSFRLQHSWRAELFYWVTIMFSQTLGTALGDWTAESQRWEFLGAAVLFGALLAVVVVLYFSTRLSRTGLFWTAFILTRPLGAALGDFFDKPRDAGGLEISRYLASAILAGAMILVLALFRPKAARHSH